MRNLSKTLLATLWLFALALCFQSCNDTTLEQEKQHVQFTISPSSASADGGRVAPVTIPQNAHAIISVASSNGVSVLADHKVTVMSVGDSYVTEAVELTAGAYSITDFVIVSDSTTLYVTPKNGADLVSSFAEALPFNFSVDQNIAKVNLPVMDARGQELNRFGYASAKTKGNSFSIAAYETNGKLTSATAQVRQNNKLINTFSLRAAVNTVNLGGDPKLSYAITVFTANAAKTQTLDPKKLNSANAKNPFKVVLQPALVLTVQSYVDEANEYQEYFNFRMDGRGTVNINWGDGRQSTETMPFEHEHEYTTGDYTAIITGDIAKATDFSGFSYGTIISAITGLRNLTSLKVYDPSWGAVPIKVDLSNCKKLERINIAKYGAPYEPIDLTTDFKLPSRHLISTFIFDAPSFDSNREYISSAELDAMLNNIYNNAVARNIRGGKFFVNPVVTPSAAAQQKIDVLTNQYNWQVGFNDEIYNAYELQAGRQKSTEAPDALREQWLRERFTNSEKIIGRRHAVSGL